MKTTQMETTHPIFDKDSQNQIRMIKIKSEEDLILVDGYINTFRNEIKRVNDFTKKRTEEIEVDIMLDIKNGSHLSTWEDRDLRVFINQSDISVRFLFDIKPDNKNCNSYEIQIDIADKSKIYDWEGKKLPKIIEKGLELFDVCGVRLPNIRINIAGDDNANEIEIVNICNFIGKEFYNKNKSELFNGIKVFYQELSDLWNYSSELATTLYSINRSREEYLLSQCLEQVKSMNLLKKDTVVVIFNKKTEFFGFNAYKINSVGTKLIHYDKQYSKFDYTWANNANKDERYYLSIKNASDSNVSISEFLRHRSVELAAGDKIVVYTLDEWKDFDMLNDSQRENIITKKTLTGDLKKISENYKRLRHL